MRPAAFLDRDGTIIEDRGYLGDPAGVTLLPGAVDALRALRDAGYLLIVITNQSGIARGIFSAGDLARVNARMRELLAAEGVTLDGLYFCPHGPDDACACRKPLPGMLHAAAEEHGIDLAASVSIGDQPRDAQAGAAAGCRCNVLLGAPVPAWPGPYAPGIREAAARCIAGA